MNYRNYSRLWQIVYASGVSAACLFGVGHSSAVYAESIDAGSLTITIADELQTDSSSVIARFDVGGCIGVFPQVVRINPETKVIDLAYTTSLVDFPTGIECGFSKVQEIPFGPLYREGEYTLNVYDNSGEIGSDFFNSEDLIGAIDFTVAEASNLANPETPQEGSTQSGIGVIRGWACDARTVAVSFNDLPPFPIAYGTTREDTREICGDANNGYGAVFAYGSLGNGTHTMTTWINGTIRSTVEFEVNGLPVPFVEGLSAEYDLPDFPSEGEAVIIRWSQPDQNFIIVEHTE